MLCKIPEQTYQKRSFLFVMRRILFIMVVLMMIQISGARAQDLVLEDMNITGEETYSTSNSITAGPNFTISITGTVTLEAGESITLVPDFVVINGGVLYALTSVENDIETQDEFNYPDDFILDQNYPNPFNPFTTITYVLPKSSSVKMSIFDIQGKEIITLLDTKQEAGYHSITWDSKDKTGLTAPAGIYLYRLKAGERIITKKLTLIK
jgi:hypothetical protein